MQKLVKDIYIESKFAGVTVGAIVGPEGIVCIDTPTRPAEARAWRQQLEQATGRPVRFVINLDHHRDRTLNNQWFEAPVVAHDITYERARMLPEMYRNSPAEAGSDSEAVDDLHGLRVILPQITFADRMTVMAGEREIQLVHRPGVTPGALWVELPEEGIVFVGDLVTNKVPLLLHEADLEVWLESLTRLRKMRPAPKWIVPGRGGVLHKDGLKTTEDVLKLIQRKLTALARARKPRADLSALVPGLLSKYPVPADLRDHYTRRLRTGLERVYDRMALAALAR